MHVIRWCAVCVMSRWTVTMTSWDGDCKRCDPLPGRRTISQLLCVLVAKSLQLFLQRILFNPRGATWGYYPPHQPWVDSQEAWLRESGLCCRVTLPFGEAQSSLWFSLELNPSWGHRVLPCLNPNISLVFSWDTYSLKKLRELPTFAWVLTKGSPRCTSNIPIYNPLLTYWELIINQI